MRAIIPGTLAAFATCLVLTACGNADYPTAPSERVLVAHGMLSVQSARQEVLVEYGRSIEEGVYYGVTPARDVSVTVRGSTEHVLTQDSQRPGWYVGNFMPTPGVVYRLDVRAPDGQHLTDATLVPGPTRLILPRRDTTIVWTDSVPIRWTRASHALAYVAFAQRPGTGGVPTVAFANAATPDTSGTFASLLATGPFSLAVAAVDANYIEYYRLGADGLDRNHFSSTVEGGYGFFGSYALSESRIITVVSR